MNEADLHIWRFGLDCGTSWTKSVAIINNWSCFEKRAYFSVEVVDKLSMTFFARFSIIFRKNRTSDVMTTLRHTARQFEQSVCSSTIMIIHGRRADFLEQFLKFGIEVEWLEKHWKIFGKLKNIKNYIITDSKNLPIHICLCPKAKYPNHRCACCWPKRLRQPLGNQRIQVHDWN